MASERVHWGGGSEVVNARGWLTTMEPGWAACGSCVTPSTPKWLACCTTTRADVTCKRCLKLLSKDRRPEINPRPPQLRALDTHTQPEED